MPRSNPWKGALQPRSTGRGRREVALVLIYDVDDDKLRTKVSETCLDYGLQRIQFSAFFGRLNRNLREELALRLVQLIQKESARVRIIPVCEEDVKQMWSLEQYRLDSDELKRGSPKPSLRVLKDHE